MTAFIVIGRIPDDEDTALVIQAASVEEATAKFTEELFDGSGYTRSDRRDLKRNHGAEVYITGVITGDNLSIVSWTP